MEFHPVANIFPMMNGEEYDALKKDILANGLLQPIYTHQDKIIDGRNRWKACQELGLEPKLKEWDGQGSLVSFVVSLNLKRRNLTASQRAAIAVEALPFFEAEAKERQRQAAIATNEKRYSQLDELTKSDPYVAAYVKDQQQRDKQKERLQEQRQVYAIKDGSRVKIGISIDPEERLKAIRVSSPDAILLGFTPDSEGMESRMHKKLEAWNVGGEWFEWCKDVEGIVNAMLASPNFGRSEGYATRIVAKEAGVSHGYISEVKKLKEQAPELFEQVKSGKVEIPDAKREVKKRQQKKAREEAIASSPEIQVKAWDGTIKPNTVSLCSVFDLNLPANSVDMIFTDPPYHDEYLSLYERLAIVADECLKEGGYCLAYAGKMFLPQVLNALSTKLEYVWTFCVWQPDNNSKIAKHHLMEMWRPIVCFKKAGKSNVEWTHDGLQGTRSKSHHEWEQQIEPPMKYIDAYTKAEDLVLEPFVGGGTTLTACQRLGRRFIGFDVDEEAIKTTMLRLKNEQTA